MKRSFSTSISTDNNQTSITTATTGTPFACIQIFRELCNDEKNFVFSPCSIQLALSLITNGATGTTLQVLLEFLDAKTKYQLKSRASKLISALTQSNTQGPELELSFVGGLWVDKSKKLLPNFKTDAERIYKAKAGSMDFKNNARKMTMTVNQWAAESSNGLINSLLPEGSIDKNTRLLLANALHFKGKWCDPFKSQNTKYDEFYLQGGGSIKVPFMKNNKEKRFIQTYKNLKVLRLPYKDSSISMYILLPHERDGLRRLSEKVCSSPLSLEKYASPDIDLVHVGRFQIPKFKINCNFEASGTLKAMGLEQCFSDNAKFDEMVYSGHVKVQNVYQESFIEVDEEGTKATASTAIKMRKIMTAKRAPPIPVDFVADHPFIYMVRDDASGMVMFMGHVVNPLLK